MNSQGKRLVRALIPIWLRPILQRLYRQIRQFVLYSRLANRIRYWGVAHYCPICRSHLRTLLTGGTVPRPNALCPVCKSFERHRLVFSFMVQRTNLFLAPRKKMLHIAPEDCLKPLFEKSEVIHYISVDLAPQAMLRMDLTDICFPDKSFDIIYASHVLEHIGDDTRAMQEMFRVLKMDGWAILQVPIKRGDTLEDPSVVDPLERERIFGQKDHVRIYGRDYYDRLRAAGFTVHRMKLPIQQNPLAARRLGLSPQEEITFCTKV